MRRKEDEKEKESRKIIRRPKVRQTFGNFGKWLFLLLLLGQNWCQCCSRRNGGGDENATKSADQRKQSKRDSPQKVEAARSGG